jgi:hypothetical protein
MANLTFKTEVKTVKNTELRLNMCAGDGVGIERSIDNGETWNQDVYINTGASVSTVKLGEGIIKAVNCHCKLLEALMNCLPLLERYAATGTPGAVKRLTEATAAIHKATGG